MKVRDAWEIFLEIQENFFRIRLETALVRIAPDAKTFFFLTLDLFDTTDISISFDGIILEQACAERKPNTVADDTSVIAANTPT
ncbi:MAG: hypothetical protein GY801_14760 [bacterium]|nr:hypothetical protein [bacterium]